MASKWINLTDKERCLINSVLSLPNIKDLTAKRIIKKMEQANKRITVSSAKGKGRGLQMWVCRKISQIIHIPFDNQDDNSLILSRPMGLSGLDIILKDKASKLFPFSIECKNSESFNLLKTIEQVQANKKPNTDYLIIYKRKIFKQPIVILEFSVFEKLFKGELYDR